jgi:hypothetical protein
MKKLVVLLLAGIMALGFVGCGTSWTTEEYNGYSFEVGADWEKERFDENSYYYYLEGDSTTETSVSVSVWEREASIDYESFIDQSEFLEKSFDDYAFDSVETKYSDVEITTIGSYAFATYTQTISYDGEIVYSGPGAKFFVSSNREITISLNCPLGEVSKYQADFDRVVNSIKLI